MKFVLIGLYALWVFCNFRQNEVKVKSRLWMLKGNQFTSFQFCNVKPVEKILKLVFELVLLAQHIKPLTHRRKMHATQCQKLARWL